MPHRRAPATWYDESTGRVYRYGGWAYNSTDWTADLWSYQPGGLTIYWSEEVTPATDGLSYGSNAPWASAWAVGNSTLYSLGGSISNGESVYPNTIVSGLVEHYPSSETWSNSTTDIPNSSPYFNQAKAEFASNFGQEGFVVVVGGTNPSEQAFTFEQDTSLRDMADIVLYDVSTKKWYVQRATGDIPPPRTEFCTVGKASSDGKTYELFVYGGMTNTTYDLNYPNEPGYLNVYVLSLPAFRWFQTPATTSTRRCSHTCSVIGNRQMVSIGGRPPSTFNQFGADFDEWASGIGVMDMTELQWKDHYDAAAAPYERAQLIQKYYDQNYVKPAWSDPALATEFAFAAPTHPTTTPTPTPTAPVQPPAKSTSPPPPHKSHTGAIAGGVVGGVVGLALIAGLAYFLGTRRNRKTTAPADSVPPPTEPKSSQIPNSPSSVQKPSPELAEAQVFERSELEGETTRQVAELPGYYGSFVPGQR
ncbi:hypothetical protein, variant [Cladophialophora immunda]|uniref:Kelch repeat protein n=1 Tax=Cladophialophora immunda TaxID=569365 RepID=A0A0D2C740_9EURO|nr:uncharacterized protein PV07_09426 [Cladophialophora immunda]XP_016246542.1 hypothetical protein, variant [Cladophialophora immunda]KIW26325.1 hypothetical protein PV07_09426 [Cladophialophora immunda]KIW26326.1 hypothetical protein, variant [Cladophialophora immunda]